MTDANTVERVARAHLSANSLNVSWDDGTDDDRWFRLNRVSQYLPLLKPGDRVGPNSTCVVVDAERLEKLEAVAKRAETLINVDRLQYRDGPESHLQAEADAFAELELAAAALMETE